MKRSLRDLIEEIKQKISVCLDNKIDIWKKPDGSFVTNIDICLQNEIIKIIQNCYPFDNIICEEESKINQKVNSEFSWVIDPIDGTSNFVSGKNEFSISIGLMQGKEFIEAFVLFPKLNEEYYAQKGSGLIFNSKKYFKNPTFSNEIILCSKTYEKYKNYFQELGYIVEFYNCATYSLLKVLHGKALSYCTVNTMLYDIGPMSFVLKRAGIESLDKDFKNIIFSPDYERIPFFISTRNFQAGRSIYDKLCGMTLIN